MTARLRGAPLRFATYLAPNMVPVYRFLADRIGERLGRSVELTVGVSFDQFERGEADLGVICGLPYVWLAARRPRPVEPLAAPVLAGDRYGGRPVYYSDVIVRRDSPITRRRVVHRWPAAQSESDRHGGPGLMMSEQPATTRPARAPQSIAAVGVRCVFIRASTEGT